VVRIVLPLEGGKYHNLAASAGEFLRRSRLSRPEPAFGECRGHDPDDLFVISRAKFDELSKAHPLWA